MSRRLLVFVALFALLASACGGGGGDDTKTSSSKRTTTTKRATPTTEPDTGGDGEPVTTTKGATATTARSGRSSSGTTDRSAGTADTNAAPAPAAPGTYDYAQSGAVGGEPVPPDGTLFVNGGGPDQVFQRYFDPAQPPSDINISFRDDGPFVTKIIVRQRGFVMSCGFDAPVPAPPWPPTNGRSFSGHATCDNGFQADFSGSITGRTADLVGGKSVNSIVINSTLHIVGTIFRTPIDITVKDTQHWAPSLRIPTYSHETISGTVSGDVTSTLKSITPR